MLKKDSFRFQEKDDESKKKTMVQKTTNYFEMISTETE